MTIGKEILFGIQEKTCWIMAEKMKVVDKKK